MSDILVVEYWALFGHYESVCITSMPYTFNITFYAFVYFVNLLEHEGFSRHGIARSVRNCAWAWCRIWILQPQPFRPARFDFLTYLSALICCGSDCCCCCDCCAGRPCKQTGDECSPSRGRRSPKSGHRTRWQEKDFHAGNGQQHASHGRDKCERVRGSAAGVPDVRDQTLEMPIWRDLRHSDCQVWNPQTSLANTRVHKPVALKRVSWVLSDSEKKLEPIHIYVQCIARDKKYPAVISYSVHVHNRFRGENRIKAKAILLYITGGADMVLQTPPACRASNILPSICELSDWSSAASCHRSSTINFITIWYWMKLFSQEGPPSIDYEIIRIFLQCEMSF